MLCPSGDQVGPTMTLLASRQVASVRSSVPSTVTIINECSRVALLTRMNANRSPVGEKEMEVSTSSFIFLGGLAGSAT